VIGSGDDVLVVDLEPEPPRPWTPPRPVAPLPFSAAAQQAAQAPGLAPAKSEPTREPYAGRGCPYCRFPLKMKEQMTVCPVCGVGHHADCWSENGGCTTYACRYSPESHPPDAGGPAQAQAVRPGTPRQPLPTPGALGSLMPPAHVAAAARLESSATNALVVSLLGLFCCGIGSLAGLAMAISVLLQMKALGIDVPMARSRALSAIVVGIAVPIIVVLIILATAKSSSGISPF
jgi:hypothetical protein